MRSGGMIAVAIGILLLYIVASDKFCCLTQFWNCLRGAGCGTDAAANPDAIDRADVGNTAPESPLVWNPPVPSMPTPQIHGVPCDAPAGMRCCTAPEIYLGICGPGGYMQTL